MLVLKNIDINLKDTITCGQCFQFYEEKDNSFTMILKDRVINIKHIENNLVILSNKESQLESVIYEYFDLHRNYNNINQILLKRDKNLKNCIEKSKGFKILKQDPFETLISFVISQNNNVTRISNAVRYISKKYGTKVVFQNKDYYLFPTFEQLKNITIEDLKEIKLGYRDKYIINVLESIKNKSLDLEKINYLSTDEALDYLLQVNGIGPKVASCILLFAYAKYDVFPIDTWVKKQMSLLYSNIPSTQSAISQFAKKTYGEYCGIALQYMYHALRNQK